MPTTCQITFENSDGVYYAGKLLRGAAHVTLTKEKTIRGIFVRIYGRALTHWSEWCTIKHNPNDKSSGGHRVNYSGEEIYLNEKSYCIGGENAGKTDLKFMV